MTYSYRYSIDIGASFPLLVRKVTGAGQPLGGRESEWRAHADQPAI